MVDLSEMEAANAIWEAAVLGRQQKLLAYLRSDRPLAAMDRHRARMISSGSKITVERYRGDI